jgi:hypothetical protein
MNIIKYPFLLGDSIATELYILLETILNLDSIYFYKDLKTVYIDLDCKQ